MTAAVLNVFHDWSCPNCTVTDRTPAMPGNSVRMHQCAGLHGLTAPMVVAGTDCKVTAVERQDYLGDEQQRTGDDGKPYMSVVTERADGSTDAVVFPGVAVFGVRA